MYACGHCSAFSANTKREVKEHRRSAHPDASDLIECLLPKHQSQVDALYSAPVVTSPLSQGTSQSAEQLASDCDDSLSERSSSVTSLHRDRDVIDLVSDDEGASASARVKKSCSLCEKEFESVAALNLHLEKSHADQVSFTCRLCGMTLIDDTDLQLHYTQKHPDDYCRYDVILREPQQQQQKQAPAEPAVTSQEDLSPKRDCVSPAPTIPYCRVKQVRSCVGFIGEHESS